MRFERVSVNSSLHVAILIAFLCVIPAAEAQQNSAPIVGNRDCRG